MNVKEVYINGVLLELDEANNPIQLVYAINDLAELKDRQAYSTNTFKIPKTLPNLLACGFPDDPTLIQIQPYRKNTAKIVQGGVEVLPNAVALIDGGDKEISVQILSGLIGFFDSIGDKKLIDLDLSAYDHVWNLANVSNSQVNTDGYIYPIIDYGGLSETQRRVDVRQLRPATFRKTIIEQIAIDAGYTLTGVALSYAKYLTSIIPFTNDAFKHGQGYADNLATYKTSARNNTPQSLPATNLNTVIVFQDNGSTDQYGQWVSNEFTAQKGMRATISLKYDITMQDVYLGGAAPRAILQIQKFIAGVWTTIAENTTTSTFIVSPEDFLNQQATVVSDMQIGDKYRVNYFQQPAVNRLYSVLHSGASISFDPIATDVTYGSDVQLSATLPDVSQKNFFKDFLQNFGLIAIPDPYKKEILLINMEEVYDNKSIAEDITGKLINSIDKVSYSLSGYGINNFGKYKQDDAVKDGIGDGVLVFDNQTLEDNNTLFTSLFACSQVVYKQSLEITEIKKIEDIVKSSDFKVKTEPRILLNKTVAGLYLFVDDVAFIEKGLISLPTFTGLSYVDLFAENYPEILRMLYKPFVVTKQILLKEIDIANIDWRIPVYDSKSASYYYKNNITYLQNGISSITLIRMP